MMFSFICEISVALLHLLKTSLKTFDLSPLPRIPLSMAWPYNLLFSFFCEVLVSNLFLFACVFFFYICLYRLDVYMCVPLWREVFILLIVFSGLP